MQNEKKQAGPLVESGNRLLLTNQSSLPEWFQKQINEALQGITSRMRKQIAFVIVGFGLATSINKISTGQEKLLDIKRKSDSVGLFVPDVIAGFSFLTDAGETSPGTGSAPLPSCPLPQVEGKKWVLTGTNCEFYPFNWLVIRLENDATVKFPRNTGEPSFELMNGILWVAEYDINRPTKTHVMVRGQIASADIIPEKPNPEDGQRVGIDFSDSRLVRVFSEFGGAKVNVSSLEEPVFMEQGELAEIPLEQQQVEPDAGFLDSSTCDEQDAGGCSFDASTAEELTGYVEDPTPTPPPMKCDVSVSERDSQVPSDASKAIGLGIMLLVGSNVRRRKAAKKR